MDKKEQTVVEHLTEFRRRFIWVLAWFFVVFCLSLLFSDSLYRYLTAGFQQKLIVLGPNDILWIYISLASLMAFSLTLPFTVYQIWAFIRPALKASEARAVSGYIPATFFCFVAGLAFGYYFVSPAILQVLLSLGQGLFDTQLTAQNYLTFLLHTSLPIAILFELPVLVAFLTSIGLLNPNYLVKYRRYAYFVLLVIAVVITPADFISDLTMTVPLLLIFELSILISKHIFHKKEKRK
ncbi:twin-arginine translocase subunit TatC [Streptococcus massiliensis]|uniref:Sec-independent protein translocase protein TatC n=1 Tax=Streptococcus massiliensis TaxID=313439 RepID=A0A380KVB8_9STRE|nr:twin-arginine translocase subunit TatC [Streptococcus massiliensis]SUN75873.1 TatC, sec-independent protein translocase [Streptococcus massiliensis]